MYTGTLVIVSNFVVLVLICPVVHGQSGLAEYDPIFGIPYLPRKVHFENAPSKIGRLCREARGRGRRFSLYAYWKDGSTEYMVVSDAVSEDTGIGIILSGGECHEGQAAALLWGGDLPGQHEGVKPITPSDSVLNGLAMDLLHRYAAAFGGKKEFLAAVKRLKGFNLADLPPMLRKRFEEYAMSPHKSR